MEATRGKAGTAKFAPPAAVALALALGGGGQESRPDAGPSITPVADRGPIRLTGVGALRPPDELAAPAAVVDRGPLRPADEIAPPAAVPPLVGLQAARPQSRRSYLVAGVNRRLRLHARPGGPVVRVIGPRTEFRSPRVLSVARVRGRWLGVITSTKPNGRLTWVARDAGALRLRRTAYSLHADLSRRSLELRRGGRSIAIMPVGIGTAATRTPTGRFAVTDKLRGPSVGPAYGCCIVALSGFQPKPPRGWRNGTRLAVHGTPRPGTVGTASSAGCLRASKRSLRVLMRRVPLGAPVFITR